MKKICFSLVAASAMLFSAHTVTAQEVPPVVVEEEIIEQPMQDDFRQIEIEELPAEVQQAVERDYAGAVIAEAHVKEHEGEQKFKLKLTTSDGEEKELYADAQGNWIDKDKDQE